MHVVNSLCATPFSVSKEVKFLISLVAKRGYIFPFPSLPSHKISVLTTYPIVSSVTIAWFEVGLSKCSNLTIQ